MPRDLFGDVTRPSISIGNRKWYTLPLSLFSHSAIVLALIAIPILAPSVMPSVFADDELAWMKITVPNPPPLPQPPRVQHSEVPPANPNAAPLDAPNAITPEKPRVESGWENGTGTVIGLSDVGTVFNDAPPPPVEKAPPVPVRVGVGVRQPIKINDVPLVYPQMAQQVRLQGIVIIEATIGETGNVVNARILRSVPLLDQAALDAVRQWRYTPTLLNGVPVPVIMTVTVNFTLK